jgi:hypothetical protein
LDHGDVGELGNGRRNSQLLRYGEFRNVGAIRLHHDRGQHVYRDASGLGRYLRVHFESLLGEFNRERSDRLRDADFEQRLGLLDIFEQLKLDHDHERIVGHGKQKYRLLCNSECLRVSAHRFVDHRRANVHHHAGGPVLLVLSESDKRYRRVLGWNLYG